MNSEIRHELLEAARVFWRRQPWRRLEDTHNFGLRDRETGTLACGVVLGNAGYQYGMVLYLGAEGFEVARRLADDELDREGLAYSVDFLAVYFTRDEEIPRSDRKRMGVVGELDSNGFILLPNVIRKRPAATATLPSDGEAGFLAKALRAVSRLVASKRLVSDRLRDRNALPLFVLPTRIEGKIAEEVSPRPGGSLPETELVPLEVPGRLLARLLRRPKRGRILAAVTLAPVAVKGEQARMLLVYDEDRDTVLDSHLFLGPCAVTEASLRFLGLLAGEVAPSAGKKLETPSEVWTDAVEFHRSVEASLRKSGIESLCLERIEELDRVRDALREQMATRGSKAH
jgi:hypothetical protein